MADNFVGACAPSLFRMPFPPLAASDSDVARLPNRTRLRDVLGCRRPCTAVDPMAEQGGGA